jgi:hypothetical protein
MFFSQRILFAAGAVLLLFVGITRESPRAVNQAPATVTSQLGSVTVSGVVNTSKRVTEVSVHNNGQKAVIAFALDMTIQTSGGKTRRTEFAMDFIQTPEGAPNRGIAAGEQRSFDVPYPASEPGIPTTVEIVPSALVFDDNHSLGMEPSIQKIFGRRETNRLAYEEAHTLIQEMRASKPQLDVEQLLTEIEHLQGKYLKPRTAMFIVDAMRSLNRSAPADAYSLAIAAVELNRARAAKGTHRSGG